jgi:DNA helicase HerA-like ATPase
MKQIKVSEKLNLPPEIVTLTSAILGIRNSGKTNTAVVITEGLLDAGHQVVVIDPLDVWWGLKSSADGKSDGYPVVVIGGPHGDHPARGHRRKNNRGLRRREPGAGDPVDAAPVESQTRSASSLISPSSSTGARARAAGRRRCWSSSTRHQVSCRSGSLATPREWWGPLRIS